MGKAKTKKVANRNTFIDKLNLKSLKLVTIFSFSISVLVKIYIINDKSNTNNLNIGETGQNSSVTISQINTQSESGDNPLNILFLILVVIAIISSIIILYKKLKNED